MVVFSPFFTTFHLSHLESPHVQNRHDGKSACCFSCRRAPHSPDQRGTATPHASQDGLKREAVRVVRGAASGSDSGRFACHTHSLRNDLSSAARSFPAVLGSSQIPCDEGAPASRGKSALRPLPDGTAACLVGSRRSPCPPPAQPPAAVRTTLHRAAYCSARSEPADFRRLRGLPREI